MSFSISCVNKEVRVIFHPLFSSWVRVLTKLFVLDGRAKGGRWPLTRQGRSAASSCHPLTLAVRRCRHISERPGRRLRGDRTVLLASRPLQTDQPIDRSALRAETSLSMFNSVQEPWSLNPRNDHTKKIGQHQNRRSIVRECVLNSFCLKGKISCMHHWLDKNVLLSYKLVFRKPEPLHTCYKARSFTRFAYA